MKKTIRLGVLIVTTITALVVSAGCARRETPVSRFAGTSYALAIQSQLANPDAGIKDGPPTGMEGTVAQKVINRYEQGFAAPAAKTNAYSIAVEGVQQK